MTATPGRDQGAVSNSPAASAEHSWAEVLPHCKDVLFKDAFYVLKRPDPFSLKAGESHPHTFLPLVGHSACISPSCHLDSPMGIPASNTSSNRKALFPRFTIIFHLNGTLLSMCICVVSRKKNAKKNKIKSRYHEYGDQSETKQATH